MITNLILILSIISLSLGHQLRDAVVQKDINAIFNFIDECAGNSTLSSFDDDLLADAFMVIADANETRYEGKTALHMACCINHYESVYMLLLHHPELVYSTSHDGATPLFSVNHIRLLIMLIDNGADVNHRSIHNVTVLHNAWKYSDEFVPILLRSGADVHAVNANGETPLHIGCAHNRISMIMKLIDAGANISSVNINGQTPFHYCSGIRCMNILLKYGAHVNSMDYYGLTKLHEQVAANQLGHVLFLLHNGADANLCHHREVIDPTLYYFPINGSPLHVAAYTGYVAIGLALIDHGALVNCSIKATGRTPLHFSALNDNNISGPRFTSMLLSKGANVNAIDCQGRTALHLAAESGHLLTMQSLLRDGAMVDIVDNLGQTASDLARNQSHHQCVDELLKWSNRMSSNNRRILPISLLISSCAIAVMAIAKQRYIASPDQSSTIITSAAAATIGIKIAIMIGERRYNPGRIPFNENMSIPLVPSLSSHRLLITLSILSILGLLVVFRHIVKCRQSNASTIQSTSAHY